MLPIQVFILLLLAFSLLLSILVLRNRVFARLFFGVQFIAGGVFVLMPDLSSRLAALLGVGRGTDLLLYMLIMLFYITVLAFTARIRRMERSQTLMVRAMAIENAKKPVGSVHCPL